MNENVIKAHQSQSELVNFAAAPDFSLPSAISALISRIEPKRDLSK